MTAPTPVPAPAPTPAPPKAATGPKPSKPSPTPARPGTSGASRASGTSGLSAPSGRLDLDKLYTARLHAARVRPYLATALYALHTVESPQVPTMAVDRHWRCYVSPSFVDRTPVEELAGVWVHEVSHLLRDHHGRGDRFAREEGVDGPAERLRMNIAADCEINDDVYGDGLTAPAGAVRPERLRLPTGLLMEEYLRQFRLQPVTLDLAWLDCGSGSDGLDRAWESGPDGAHGLTAQERDAVRFRVARGINGAPGTAPKGWERWAEEVFHPPQPWRALLGGALRAAAGASGAGEDYGYGRPSRRSAAVPGAVLPSLRRRPPHVSVIVDTSGSVSDEELGTALLEIAAITRAVGGRRDLVTVVSCDASAQAVHPLCRAQGIPLVGGGGTDLRQGFAAALRTRPRPDVVVVLTDGQTPWPSASPPCRTVVGLFPRSPSVGSRYQRPQPPGWARVVRLGGG
ncbi:vWA domain-containing protein [Actinacidiphila yeochonensis]|uniref:vWA domain-containing protein n=1 Tax=Actinacidiphila yeochonensis TaxID=89050 RepID=UPI00099BC02A|nr:VWA-like domain-containing protein [Actinacidiphila yeochonensis]